MHIDTPPFFFFYLFFFLFKEGRLFSSSYFRPSEPSSFPSFKMQQPFPTCCILLFFFYKFLFFEEKNEKSGSLCGADEWVWIEGSSGDDERWAHHHRQLNENGRESLTDQDKWDAISHEPWKGFLSILRQEEKEKKESIYSRITFFLSLNFFLKNARQERWKIHFLQNQTFTFFKGEATVPWNLSNI